MKNCKRWISMMVLFFILSFSFFGGTYNAYSCVDETNVIGQEEYLSQVGEISQCISEENRIVTSQLGMLRQLVIRKNLFSGIIWNLSGDLRTQEIILSLMAFLVISIGTANRSQKFIIHYIHNKDGQKA